MKSKLPMDEFLPLVVKQLRDHSSLIVSAAPGAGKTTRLPPALLALTQKKVLVLEPRRIAAMSAAARIAEEENWVLGQEVGYQVRFENCSSSKTRLLFLTEALLLKKIAHDPELADVGCVVLDEFHERSLHVDLALGVLLELQQLDRPDLQIVVMSATLDASPLSKFLGGAPIVEVPGRIFPLKIQSQDKAQLLRTGPDWIERLSLLVRRALSEIAEGDLLCFVPGAGEIERLRKDLLEKGIAPECVFSLHGRLKLEEQRQALQPLIGKRKIILATNVAESSLTVEGVRIVVDSGLMRISQLHEKTGFESLDLVRISKASAKQRAGRAARTQEGFVYQAWTAHDERSMKEFETAEIHRSDLSEALLCLAGLGISQFQNFLWFERPDSNKLKRATENLVLLGALDQDQHLTELGRKMVALPVSPRIAKLLLEGQRLGFTNLACELAALLSERFLGDFRFSNEENDLKARWQELKQNPSRFPQHKRVSEQLKTMMSAPKSDSNPPDWEQLLFTAFSDRLCRRRRSQEPMAIMVGGRGVRLDEASCVKKSEFFLALELFEASAESETRVPLAAGLSESFVQQNLLTKATKTSHLHWDRDQKSFFIIESRDWKGLSVAGENRRPARPEEVNEQLSQVAIEEWDLVRSRNEDFKNWWERLCFFERALQLSACFDETRLKETLEQACFGESSLQSLFEKDLVSIFEQQLAPDLRLRFERECPSSWTVPSGRRHPIQYTLDQGALVEVRLQELFGTQTQPVIAGQPLTLVLLAPNGRPVQVTRDLASFWKNGYVDVRKEMRARYPKHSWPEDPLTAVPQAKGRPGRA